MTAMAGKHPELSKRHETKKKNGPDTQRPADTQTTRQSSKEQPQNGTFKEHATNRSRLVPLGYMLRWCMVLMFIVGVACVVAGFYHTDGFVSGIFHLCCCCGLIFVYARLVPQ